VVAKIARHSFDLTSPRNRKAAEMRSLWSALTAIVCGIGFSARAEEAPVGFVKALSGTATVMHPSLQLSGPTSTASSRALSKPRRGSRLSISFIFRQGRQSSNPRSRGDLGATIASAKGTPNVDISVVGHTDVTGADPYNLALSLRRAESVSDALVAASVPSDIIEIAYHGANNLLIPAPRGVPPEQRNRRVAVTIR
jgi:outer membrane protein OmpA-like peptidoglycan-associated protein